MLTDDPDHFYVFVEGIADEIAAALAPMQNMGNKEQEEAQLASRHRAGGDLAQDNHQMDETTHAGQAFSAADLQLTGPSRGGGGIGIG